MFYSYFIFIFIWIQEFLATLYDNEIFPLNEKLTNSYLTKVKGNSLKDKIINRIMNSTKEVLTHCIKIEDYLAMDIDGPTNF